MFISRKKYEEALEAARKEGAEKVWEQQRNERYMEDVCRRFEEMDKRLSLLEKENQPVNVRLEGVTRTTRPRYCFGGIAIDA